MFHHMLSLSATSVWCHSVVGLERRVEAVFVSYSLYGKWNPHEASIWLPRACKGLDHDNFLALARDAKLLKRSIALQQARSIFHHHSNMVRFHKLCPASAAPLM